MGFESRLSTRAEGKWGGRVGGDGGKKSESGKGPRAYSIVGGVYIQEYHTWSSCRNAHKIVVRIKKISYDSGGFKGLVFDIRGE